MFPWIFFYLLLPISRHQRKQLLLVKKSDSEKDSDKEEGLDCDNDFNIEVYEDSKVITIIPHKHVNIQQIIKNCRIRCEASIDQIIMSVQRKLNLFRYHGLFPIIYIYPDLGYIIQGITVNTSNTPV